MNEQLQSTQLVIIDLVRKVQFAKKLTQDFFVVLYERGCINAKTAASLKEIAY